jgi:DNA-binding transcriptional ArsR family regulator
MTNINPFDALSDRTRRRIIEHLREGPRSVNELVAAAQVSQPAVSQHLRLLKSANLVIVKKRGQQRIYRLNLEGLADLRAYIESFWDGVLGAYQQSAEGPNNEEARNE